MFPSLFHSRDGSANARSGGIVPILFTERKGNFSRRYDRRRMTLRSSALHFSPLSRLAADDFLHLGGELFQAEGLGQEVDVGVGVEVLAERILGVARDEDDLHVGMGLAHLAHQA